MVLGKCEFAAEYAGRVFVFDNEVNLNMFLSNARRYLTVLPQLPKTTNIFITGPRKSGKKTIANMLAEVYGLKVVNVQDIIEQIIAKQRRF